MIQKKEQKNKGFSLVELVVVISIFAIMTTVSSLNYNQHRAVIERSNLSQDVALTVRQAQVYGISASARNIGELSVFEDENAGFNPNTFFDNDPEYNGIADVTKDRSVRGVSFDYENNTITIFEDNDNNKVYNNHSLSFDRVIDYRKILSRSISIDYFYLCNGLACEKLDSGVLDISFERPYPDAIINYREENSITADIKPYTKATIILSDGTEGDNEYVEIYSLGSIVVKSDHNIEQ